MHELIAIGLVTRPVGVRGEVRIQPLTFSVERFRALSSVQVGRTAAQAEGRRLLRARAQGDGVVLNLEGVETREQADALRGMFIFVASDDSVPPPAGSYRVDDIIGSTVVLPSGRAVGTVADVLVLPGNDVWVVRDGDREYLVPAVKELILSVDVMSRRIAVAELDGLFE